jgi:hypothetical protein
MDVDNASDATGNMISVFEPLLLEAWPSFSSFAPLSLKTVEPYSLHRS